MIFKIEKVSQFVNKGWRWLYLHLWQYRTIGRVHARRVAQVAARGKARVVMLAMSMPMWRYQHLYELLVTDSRFDVKVVLSPCTNLRPEQQRDDLEGLRQYFAQHGTPYHDFDFEAGVGFDFGAEFDPDIVFYPQPYEHLLCPAHDCLRHYDRLLCYYPYAFMTGGGKFSYNFHFHNLAWRLYYTNEQILQEAQKTAWNRGRNVRIVGYPTADDFSKPTFSDPWRVINDGRPRKRLIWAPHFSIDSRFGIIGRSNFLWMAHFMLDVAQRYKEFLQIAFKPHPRLLSELYNHPEWGPEKTDAYYRMWDEMENTQLELGDHVDLFMTSDAMVHDSGSFVIEYFYAHKPVMYVSRQLEYFLTEQTDFAREAYSKLYIGTCEREILDFIDTSVLGGEDPRRDEREQFFDRYLRPPGGKTVAELTRDDLVASLGL